MYMYTKLTIKCLLQKTKSLAIHVGTCTCLKREPTCILAAMHVHVAFKMGTLIYIAGIKLQEINTV